MALVETLSELPSRAAESEAGGTLTVDLDAIEANWRALSLRAVPAECGAVVKADAYGLGLDAVTAKLAAAGCRTFFVADIAEARRVRMRAREAAIYVLNGAFPESVDAFAELDARPVINSMTELAEWDAVASARDWRGGAAIHVDTGMNRLGISADEAAALASRVQHEGHGITLLMSHLACAETPEHSLNARQLRIFRDLRVLFRNVPASIANSSGIFLADAPHFDLVRPGAALYGINPTPAHSNPMRGVVELTAPVLQIRTVARGESVGYGATWTAKRTSRIAVAALGYADGLPRSASNGTREHAGTVVIAGKRCPFVGRISMDLVCIDITDLPDGVAHRRDAATFIGVETTIDDIARSAGTIGYEILTRLSRAGQRICYRGS